MFPTLYSISVLALAVRIREDLADVEDCYTFDGGHHAIQNASRTGQAVSRSPGGHLRRMSLARLTHPKYGCPDPDLRTTSHESGISHAWLLWRLQSLQTCDSSCLGHTHCSAASSDVSTPILGGILAPQTLRRPYSVTQWRCDHDRIRILNMRS